MPNSKKSKPAPAKKHPAPKHAAPKSAAKHPPAKPAAQPKTSSHAKHAPTPAKHQPAKPAPAKHQPPKANVPSSSNKSSAKKPAQPEPAKKAAVKPVEPAKVAPKAEPKAAHAEKPAPIAKPATPKAAAGKTLSKADALRARILERRSAKPIAFTLDEVREIAKVNVAQGSTKNGGESKTAAKQRTAAEELEAKMKKAAQPHHVKAASLADILGYNPAKQAAPTVLNEAEIDPKFQRYYKLLIELREHVASGLNTHTEETLKRSSKDDAGDLSSYAQHMADAGTDTFDRDFALSLVSNEQEALAEIEAAIQRIKNGTYGVCELTGKPINKERLLAVPFARFSVESQTEVEKTRRRSASRAGLFGEGEEGGKIEDDGGGDE
ncbi:MAG TPA: TraR/DksA C4-type zinc finger protein [Opitutaceae bacterium]|nr:TraR/DksA C4-type zinc finger protein [Opitutaceae bacterium]